MNAAAAGQGPHAALEALIHWATPEERKDDLLQGKAEYFQRTGEVFDDDRQLEARMAGFLEFFVCDRVSPALGCTPAVARYELALREEGPELAREWLAFTATTRALFEVRALAQGTVGLRELFSLVDYRVAERRQLVGLQVGDVLEARLIAWGGQHHFSGAWSWHPHEAAPAILAEARRRLKVRDPRSPAELADDCAQRSLKVDRYRQIPVERIYEFGIARTTPLPAIRGR